MKKHLSMKTNILLLGAVVTAFAFTSFAAEPLLSPRAQAGQIQVATGSVDTQFGSATSTSPAQFAPRAQANQIQVFKGTVNDVNPALVCQKTMSGSPKIVAACSSNTTMPGCLKIASLK
jgi:hypothetical protein